MKPTDEQRIPYPKCCTAPNRHRGPLTSYWYRARNGWHCWQCDGRRDDGWQQHEGTR